MTKQRFSATLAILFSILILPAICVAQTGEKTLSRITDPIIIAGEKIPSLLGSATGSLRVYSATDDGVLEPIPYQIDERDAEGGLVFPFGPKSGADADPSFDANDELVFMSRDTGTRAARDAWPAGADCGVEITVSDPLDGSTGYAYLLRFDNPPPRSETEYVQFIPGKSLIVSPNYETGFCPDATISFCNLTLTEKGGGDGSDYMDRLKIRARGTLRLVKAEIVKTETDFVSEVIAWIDGPVRVIRRSNNIMYLFWKIPSPGSLIDNVYYLDSFIFPTEVDVPFDLNMLLADFKFRVSTDHNSHASGKRYANANNPGGVIIDGVTSEAEKAMSDDPFDWMVVHGTREGGRGGWVNRIKFDAGLEARPYMFYNDDASTPEPPEDDPGQYGNTGFDVRNMHTLKQGVWRIESFMYNDPDYHPGDEIEYLNILDHPLQVGISGM